MVNGAAPFVDSLARAGAAAAITASATTGSVVVMSFDSADPPSDLAGGIHLTGIASGQVGSLGE